MLLSYFYHFSHYAYILYSLCTVVDILIIIGLLIWIGRNAIGFAHTGHSCTLVRVMKVPCCLTRIYLHKSMYHFSACLCYGSAYPHGLLLSATAVLSLPPRHQKSFTLFVKYLALILKHRRNITWKDCKFLVPYSMQ